jgi:hypothetical protein
LGYDQRAAARAVTMRSRMRPAIIPKRVRIPTSSVKRKMCNC